MTTVRTLLRALREYTRAAVETPLLITGEVILECALPFVMAMLVDSLSDAAGMGPILRIGAVLVVMAMLSLLFGVLAGARAATASAGFARHLRQDLFFKVQDFSFADIDSFSSASLVTRMTTDVTNVQNAFQMLIRVAVRVPLMVIFSVVMTFTINPRIALIFLAMLPLLAGALFGIVFYVFPVFKRIFKKYDALNNSVQENIDAIRVVKSFVAEEHEKQRFRRASGDVAQDFTFAEKVLALNNPIMSFFIFTAIMLVNVVGARIIIVTNGAELTTGQLSSLMTYGIQILVAMMMLAFIFVMTTMAAESANRIGEVLTHEPTLTSPVDGVSIVEDGSVVFENVSFAYSADAETKALTDISLSIESGERIGIVGATGSAKTTLIHLISRLYDASGGRVLVGGTDVRDYDLHALRSQIAVVLQKNVLFSGTIAENLRWGDPDATDEELHAACVLANADEFISQFPDGYDTMISQGGTNVSGGQKQRLCIARAILKKPKVLILDDSTSAVDTKTDARIRSALRSRIPGTTTIIIAQRLSSVEDADQIVVLDDGRIAEQGTHAQLMANHGQYRQIYDSQNRSHDEVAS
ncbi:ABC transporter ATP-binding protein [Actinomyces mediterranea]|uniref:ABC transporter ATP-binding protein n=1 Tax=Actinomyces mediterranea TaxID=1871028 RepID=UPI000970E0B5|nr:ABC transporter ATP-binding protein [Actinomyces mediterranea]